MIVAIIPAKAESNRLPNKNLLTINGKTLVEHAVQYAKKAKSINSIYVSTNSEEIAKHSKQLGVGVIMRGSNLGGETPLIEIYRHAWKEINDEDLTHIVGIQPDNPDRKIDLDRAVDYAVSKNIDNLFTVDSKGQHNGALNILNMNALTASPFVYASTMRDDCTNIHTPFDFALASRNLSKYADVIRVGERRIGKGEPAFVIAEAACNHMCQLDMARKMIDLAFEAGADAIKFQTYKAEHLARKMATAYWAGQKISQIDYYRKLDKFGVKEYAELFNYAKDKGIIAFSTPFDIDSASMLNELGMQLFKIASCDLPDTRLLRHVANFNKPIILSTGASTPEEIDQAILTIFETGNFQLILLACTLSYPTKNEDANISKIKSLQQRYPGMIIGLSDHTEPDEDMIIPSVGVAMGAKVIEKHYTLDRSMTGSGHFFSADPDDLKKMVLNIRLVETVAGSQELKVFEAEEAARNNARRSIVAAKFIKKGEVITAEMLGMKRPADGLPGYMIDEIIGKKAKTDIEADENIMMEMFEW